MTSVVQPGDAWWLWAAMISGVGLCIYLEQNFKWAAKTSGPVLALIAGMILSNSKLLPTASPAYDVVDDYLVPVAIPLLLFRANVVRIVRESGSMFKAFHVAAIGTVLGALLAGLMFRGTFPRVPEVAGIMTGSYIGGGVNFVAISKSYEASSELTNPLLVADNFIMAGIFAVLFIIAGSRFFLHRYPHPHSVETVDAAALAAKYWQRKEIALLDIAQALAIAFIIAAVSIKATGAIKSATTNKFAYSIFGNPFVFITVLTVALTTLGHRWTERVHGCEELGVYLLYIFFFVIGLRADLWLVLLNVPVLFAFCLVIAVTNLLFTLLAGRFLKLNIEELLLSVNATLGGPASAGAMAISKGWSNLVLPAILAGLWGYIIGTFIGIA
ncbi:MAG: DUF819 family protein, partial [Verrucomicrobia subdivision 3 bacterium]|nr:DUF819 family protein [Limisphaerales bacterium]